jgi:hypothetical protein
MVPTFFRIPSWTSAKPRLVRRIDVMSITVNSTKMRKVQRNDAASSFGIRRCRGFQYSWPQGIKGCEIVIFAGISMRLPAGRKLRSPGRT